jgi:hypothetical protein
MPRKLLTSGMKQRLIAQKMKRSIGAIQCEFSFLKSPGSDKGQRSVVHSARAEG